MGGKSISILENSLKNAIKYYHEKTSIKDKGDPQMPHVIIKTISGPSKEALQKAAIQISDIIEKTLGKPKKYISVSFEEYSFDQWENVYKDCIEGKDNILVKPGYTNPKTFQ